MGYDSIIAGVGTKNYSVHNFHCARIVATGRSDFPNQVNNRLALIIHDRFYCNRGYAAATGGLAAQSVNGLQ